MESLLTPEEIARIRQEEVLRAEIRKELTPPAQTNGGRWRQKVWKFLNSTLGIWFLSTVVVAGLVHFYNSQQAAHQEREAERKEAAAESRRTQDVRERLNIEISFRLSSTITRLKAVSKKCADPPEDKCQRAIIEALDPLRKPADEENPPLYPEYKSFSGLALIAELRRYADDGEQVNLTNILAKTSGFIEKTVRDMTDSKQSARDVASGLLEEMSYGAWKVGFPYTDCKYEEPFC